MALFNMAPREIRKKPNSLMGLEDLTKKGKSCQSGGQKPLSLSNPYLRQDREEKIEKAG